MSFRSMGAGGGQAELSITAVVYFTDIPVIESFITSLLEAGSYLDEEGGIRTHFYLVDNSESHAYFSSLELLADRFCDCDSVDFTLIKAPSNLGYGGGNNLVLERLRSSYHLVINPDVVVEREALWRAVSFLKREKLCELVTPAVVSDDGEIEHVAKIYPDCFTLLLRYLGVSRLSSFFRERMDRYQCAGLAEGQGGEVQLAGGCFLLMRTKTFKALKGFDERFFMYFEDYDLSIRVGALGQLLFVPEVRITHAGGDVGRKNFSHHLFFSMSALKFFKKHGWKFW